MKILNGISSVSLQSTRYLTDALKHLGYHSDIVVYRSNKVLLNFEDKNLNIDTSKKWKYPYYAFKILMFFVKSLFTYNVFHFHFGYSLLPLNLDLFLLKIFKKKVFMEYHGSDIRRKSIFQRNKFSFNQLGLQDEDSYKKQKRISRHITGLIVHDLELKENLYDFNVPIYILPLRLNINEFIPAYPFSGNKKLLIIHSPTNRDIKGTDFVEKAIESLGRKYPIEFKLLTNLPNSELKLLFNKADIIVDQLIIGAYGMLSIEAMALGKPVVCYLREELFDENIICPPVFNASIDNIETKLEELITNFELRYSLGIEGRKFVEKYHDSNLIAKNAVDIYSGRVRPDA